MEVLKHYFDKGQSLTVVRHYFSQGKDVIRIAVGFFTIRGYNLIRRSAADKKVLILVGIEEPGEKRLRKVLIQEILLDLRTGLDSDRRQAVVELVEKMEGGSFRIVDARAMAHHAKLYIVDETVALVASANVSGRGLIEAIEAGTVVEDEDDVKYYIQKYDAYFYSPDCFDITQDLIDALKSWLQLASPWDIYLKTLLTLKSLEDTQLQRERPAYQKPVGFQRDVVARALRQIEEHGGAMVVASTGLGKTTIGTDIALRLQEAGRILNVMVIGPKATEKSWRRQLSSAGLPCDYYIHQVFDVADAAHNGDVIALEETLATIDSSWLIIIDESHKMRNRYMDKMIDQRRKRVERLVFQHLVPAIQSKKSNILLLTGTPFSIDVENINNQLFLLPHTGPSRTLLEEFSEDRAWQIQELPELKELPVASVITTPYVAKHYGDRDEHGVSVKFNDEPHYIPRVHLYRTSFKMLLEEVVTKALEDEYFKIQNSHRMYTASIEKIVRVAWSSSPWALRDALKKVLCTPGEQGYDVTFRKSLAERQDCLLPIVDALDGMEFTEDPKLASLCRLFDYLNVEDNKAIVFCEQHATAVYLDAALKILKPLIHVACTIRHLKTGEYKMKPRNEVETLLSDFAPSANKNTRPNAKKYDVFVTTDAYGVGVNMQDARIVINYDLAWTPIEPAQRAGRVLRFWPLPRVVELHVFVPQLREIASELSRDVSDVSRRWRTLTTRHSQANQILDLPTLTTESEHIIDMHKIAPDAPLLLEKLGELDLTRLEEQTTADEVSSIFRHTAVLERHKMYAQGLSDDLSSVLAYPGKHPLIYVLLKHNGKPFWPVYNVRKKKLEPALRDSALLDLIECGKEENPAWEDLNTVERMSSICISAWCAYHNVEADQVERVCTLYLKPQEDQLSLQEWLDA